MISNVYPKQTSFLSSISIKLFARTCTLIQFVSDTVLLNYILPITCQISSTEKRSVTLHLLSISRFMHRHSVVRFPFSTTLFREPNKCTCTLIYSRKFWAKICNIFWENVRFFHTIRFFMAQVP